MRKFIVKGTYNDKEINEEVVAESKSQAKVRAGYSSGNGGSNMHNFMTKAKLKIYPK